MIGGDWWTAIPDWAGTVPGWITAASSMGVLTFIAKLYLGSRKLSIDERRLTIEEEGSIRDHYATELGTLRKRLDERAEEYVRLERHLRDMLEEEERRHEECRNDRDVLRGRLTSVEDEVVGLKRQIARYSAEHVIRMERDGGKVTKFALAAARRVIDQYEKENGD